MITASACYIPFITLVRPYLKEFGQKFSPTPYGYLVKLLYQPMYWTAACGIACLVLYLLYDVIRRWLIIIKSSWNYFIRIPYKIWCFIWWKNKEHIVSNDYYEDNEEQHTQTDLILQVYVYKISTGRPDDLSSRPTQDKVYVSWVQNICYMKF